MKIAYLTAQYYPDFGGAEVCVHNICRTLADQEDEAVVITTVAGPPAEPDFNYGIIRLWNRTCGLLRKVPFLGKFYLHTVLDELQKEHQFDLWQVTGGYPMGVYAVEFFRKNNIPCILRCCGEDIQKFPEIGYGYRLNPKIDELACRYYPMFDGLVALTPTVLEEYRQLGIPDGKVRIIPNGCDSAKFAAIKRDNDKICELRRKYGAEDKKIILTTGRYHPKKGFDRIPEIAAYLKKSGMDFIWIIAGKGNGVILEKFPEAENLGIICVEDVVSSKGVFSLPPDSLIELYCMADIYVFPTLIETFGMVLVEAMAAGLPIVTTDAPGVRDVIEDGVNGVKVPVDDTSALAEKTAEILSDETRYRELSDNVLAMAADKYDWKVVTGHYIDFYRSLTGK